jgi:hypothetical protein
MLFLRSRRSVVLLGLLCLFLTSTIYAHPPSGIVVDAQGHVYFLFRGLVRIESAGKLTTIQEDSGGHWLALDMEDRFTRIVPLAYKGVKSNGTTLIFGDGAPLAVGANAAYYASDGSESFPTGALTVVKLSPSGQRTLFAPLLKQKLADLNDGITGLAIGPKGSVYVATWNGIVKLNVDGSIAKMVNPVPVPDCDHDPADHNPANASSPLFRGLAVDSGDNIYVAATSCHRVIKIAPDGQVTSILKAERPWSPTGVAVSGQDIYVLEYTNANGPKTEGWLPRVRQRAPDGTWKTLVTISP